MFHYITKTQFGFGSAALSLLIRMGCLCAAEAPRLEQADELPRVAVLCEHQNPELLGLSEQVEVLLGQRNDLAMLDRANIDQALREQGLISNQSQDMDAILRLGKFLRTDMLIVAGKYEGYFAWKFIDVRDGVLAGLHVMRWPTDQRQSAVAELEKAILYNLKKMRRAFDKDMHYLAIVRFVNQDISRQYDSLEEVLPILLSASLASQPKIGLVERSRLSKVAEEKTATAGTEGEYKESTVIVSGEISIVRSNATTLVSVAVAAGKPRQAPDIHFTSVAPIQEVASLVRIMADRLLLAMQVDTNEESLQTDESSEAETYFLKGNFYTSQQDNISAISLYGTACILMPTNEIYKAAYRCARRCIIDNPGFSQALRLHYYIEDVDDWKSRFYSGGITSANIPQDEGWHNTKCIAMGKPKSAPLAEQWQIAYDGYRTLLGLMLDYCKTQSLDPSPLFVYQLGSNLLKIDFFQDPLEVCSFLKQHIDSKYGYHDAGHYSLMKPWFESIYSDLQTFAKRHTLPSEHSHAALDDYARVVFDNLTQDRTPLIRVWSKLALIKTGHVGEVCARGGRSDAGQSIVNELARWESGRLPCGYPYYDYGTPVMNDLLSHLIRKDKRDIMPAIEAIRQALIEPGTSYTPALDALVHQIFYYCFRVKGVNTSEISPESVTTPYHEWTDILCQYLNYQMRMGRKDQTVAKAKAISLAERMSGAPEKAADCMAQITHIFSLYGFQYHDDVPGITNIVPFVPPGFNSVVQKKPSTNNMQFAKVAWHLDKEEIPNGRNYFKGDVVFQDDAILYYDYFRPDTRRGYFNVTVIDLATGRIVQTPFYQESLRHGGDPELGISKREIRSWCEMDGRYYVGCVGGFGVFSDGVFTMIASSRTQEVRQPLDGGRLYTVASIRPDVVKKKLYLLIQGEAARAGVWEYTPATGEQKCLINIAGGINETIRNVGWDDTHLYASGTFYALAFNTQSTDESFVLVKDYSHHGVLNNKIVETLSNVKCWQERAVRDVRVFAKGSSVYLAGGWAAQAVLGPHAIYTQPQVKENYIWKAGERQPRHLILLDKLGQEVSSTSWCGSLSVAQWTATPRGFVYQLQGGGIGLFSDLDSFLDCVPVATTKKEVVATTSFGIRPAKWPPPVVQRIPVAWHLDGAQICKSDSIYAERTQLTITNDTLRYVSNVCFGGARFIKSHAFNIDMLTGRMLSSETSTNNLFVQRQERGGQDLDAQCQRLGLQSFTRCKGALSRVAVEPDGRHIIASFYEGMLIYDTLESEKTFWIMEKNVHLNPPPAIPNVRWLDTSCHFSTIAVTSECMLFSKKSNTYVWPQKAEEPYQIVLVGKNGEEVPPQNYRSKEFFKWVAVPQGFLYQLGDGSIGLIKDTGTDRGRAYPAKG